MTGIGGRDGACPGVRPTLDRAVDAGGELDSSVYGVSKPDPRVFGPALDAVGVAAGRCAYIGDTVVFDVAGAHAAGLRAIHLDPLGWCDGADHGHAVDLPTAVTTVG